MRETTVNDHSISDPQLQTFEAQLSAMAPQISPKEQQVLLYQCAFAVGHQSGRGTLRRWQAATAALVVLMSLGIAVPFVQDRWTPAQQHLANAKAPTEVKPQPTPSQQPVHESRQAPAVALDAWQVPKSAAPPFDSAEVAHTDPSVRSLTVTGLIRAMQTP